MSNNPEIHTPRVNITGPEGNARIRIGSALPDPVINGESMKRDVVVSGIQINDSNGNEIGGMGVIDGTRIGILALDYGFNEAVGMWSADTAEEKSAGLYVCDSVGFANGKHERPYKRIVIAVNEDLPSLVFMGKNGKPRLVIGLDENDNPVIDILDADGNSKSLIG